MVLMDVAGAPAACGDVSCAHGVLQVHGSIPSVAPLLPWSLCRGRFMSVVCFVVCGNKVLVIGAERAHKISHFLQNHIFMDVLLCDVVFYSLPLRSFISSSSLMGFVKLFTFLFLSISLQ